MFKIAGALGLVALIFAIIDIIHGQHTPGTARTFIHVVEFISLFPALCLLEASAFGVAANEFNMNRWLVAIFFSIGSCIFGFIIFAMAGGSFHGDGGPISLSFLVISMIGEIAFPISLIGFIIIAISRKRSGVPVLRK
jgi:hypothetical protein